MWKIMLVIVLLVISVVCLWAGNQEEVVYLKNGSVIRGVILEKVPDVSVKIQTRDGNIFVFKMEEVEKITKEEAFRYNPNENIRKVGANKKKYSLLRIGVMTAGQMKFEGDSYDIDKSNFEISAVVGSHLDENVIFGFGAGCDMYPNARLFPVFLELRIISSGQIVNPFFFADFGNAFGTVQGSSGKNGGGLMLNPGIGLDFGQAAIEIGYKMQWSKLYYYDDYYGSGSMDCRYDYLSARLGVKL